MPTRLRLWAALAAVLCLAAACGSGSATAPDPEPFVAEFPPTTPNAPPPLPDTVPPPAPPAPPSFLSDAVVFSRSLLFGSFPSDLVRRGSTVFTSDADQVDGAGARIVAIDVSGPFPVPSASHNDVVIDAGILVASDGTPVDVATPIGFGFYLNEIAIYDDHLGFVLVNAGGSDDQPTLSNLVAFDPTTGTVRQVLNLARNYTSPQVLYDSTGTLVPGSTFQQAGAEGLEVVITPAGARLYVSMTNFIAGGPSYGTVRLPGTVQVYDVHPNLPVPVAPRPRPGMHTETIRTGGYNPVAVTHLVADGGEARIMVTVAGATGFNEAFALVPTTPASVEVLRGDKHELLGTFQLGLSGLSATRPALGTDAVGHRVGFFPSSVTGEVYLLRLDGIYDPVVDAARVAVLRGPHNGIPITAAYAGEPGGNITGVALSPDGLTLVVAGFGDLFAFPTQIPGRLFLASLPDDLVTGAEFGASFIPGSTLYGTTPGRALGKVVLDPNPGTRPDVYVTVSGPIDATTLEGTGPASLGSLATHGLID